MAYISKRNRTKEKDRQTAANNRRELIAAGFKRRDLLKMGLLTSAGMLIPKKGLSARPLNTRGAFDDDEAVTNVVDTTPPAISLNGANPMTVECHTGFTDPGATASDIVGTPLVVTAPGVLAGATDPDRDPLGAAPVSSPSHGSVSLDPDGSFTYTPHEGYEGADSFAFLVSDGRGGMATATVFLTIAVHDPPIIETRRMLCRSLRD